MVDVSLPCTHLEPPPRDGRCWSIPPRGSHLAGRNQPTASLFNERGSGPCLSLEPQRPTGPQLHPGGWAIICSVRLPRRLTRTPGIPLSRPRGHAERPASVDLARPARHAVMAADGALSEEQSWIAGLQVVIVYDRLPCCAWRLRHSLWATAVSLRSRILRPPVPGRPSGSESYCTEGFLDSRFQAVQGPSWRSLYHPLRLTEVGTIVKQAHHRCRYLLLLP